MLSCSPVRSRVVEGLSPAALWWKTTLPVLGIRNWNFAVCRWRCTCHSAGTWKDLGGRNELFLLCNCVRLQGVWRTLKLDLRTLPAFQNVKLWFSFVFSTLILFSLPNWKWISLLLFTALMRLANRKDRKYCSKSSASYVTILARDIRSRCDGGVAIEAILTNILLLFFFLLWTNGSREAIWQNSLWYGSVYKAEVWDWIPTCRKKWYPLTLMDSCWTSMGMEQWMCAQWKLDSILYLL